MISRFSILLVLSLMVRFYNWKLRCYVCLWTRNNLYINIFKLLLHSAFFIITLSILDSFWIVMIFINFMLWNYFITALWDRNWKLERVHQIFEIPWTVFFYWKISAYTFIQHCCPSLWPKITNLKDVQEIRLWESLGR